MPEYQSITTLNRIRAASPCQDGWEKLLKHLGKTKPDNEPLPLLTVLDSNGLDDALWVLSFAMPDDRLARHFQAWCAEQVLPIFEAARPGDNRVRAQIATLRNDEAGEDERRKARDAARAAAGAAEADAWDAAATASRAAEAAEAVARAAEAAAGVAARAAAEAAEAAARAAAEAAEAGAGVAARAAAGAAARATQENQLRKMLAQ